MYGRQHIHRCGFEVPLVAGLSVAGACAAVLSTLLASIRSGTGEWPVRACHFHTEDAGSIPAPSPAGMGAASPGPRRRDVAWFSLLHAAAGTVSRTRGTLGL